MQATNTITWQTVVTIKADTGEVIWQAPLAESLTMMVNEQYGRHWQSVSVGRVEIRRQNPAG